MDAGRGIHLEGSLAAGTGGRFSAFIPGAEDSILPVIGKVGGSVDRVNGQHDKWTASLTAPSTRRTDRGKEAAAGREADLAEELRDAGA